jgi:hypothetical protein
MINKVPRKSTRRAGDLTSHDPAALVEAINEAQAQLATAQAELEGTPCRMN